MPAQQFDHIVSRHRGSWSRAGGDFGRPCAKAIQAASDGGNAAGLVYFIFDLLHLDGEDIAALPLIERKARLAGLLSGIAPPAPPSWRWVCRRRWSRPVFSPGHPAWRWPARIRAKRSMDLCYWPCSGYSARGAIRSIV